MENIGQFAAPIVWEFQIIIKIEYESKALFNVSGSFHSAYVPCVPMCPANPMFAPFQ